MENLAFDDIEIAPAEVVMGAARDFAVALAETSQFKAFTQAYEVVSHDVAAQQSLSAYQDKIESLRALIMLNAISQADRAELQHLMQDYLAHPSVKAYAIAESELTTLCQQVAGMISAAIGLNYAAACGASCCG